jgi:hypothetical protein
MYDTTSNMKFLTFLFPLALLACKQTAEIKTTTPITKEAATQIARDAAQEAFQSLTAELGKAMTEGGTVAAIPVCSEKAGSVVAAAATKHKVSMVRLSDKPRNPAQLARGADAAALETFLATLKRGEPVTPAVKIEDDSSATVRIPIVINNPLCLQCHGTDISPETTTALRSLYPADQATGYQLNDLRGLWKITIPAP